MRTHNTPAIMLLVLLSLLFVGRTAHAETPQEQKTLPELKQDRDEALDGVESAEKTHKIANDRLNEMISTFTRQHGSLQGISIDSTPATNGSGVASWEDQGGTRASQRIK